MSFQVWFGTYIFITHLMALSYAERLPLCPTRLKLRFNIPVDFKNNVGTLSACPRRRKLSSEVKKKKKVELKSHVFGQSRNYLCV